MQKRIPILILAVMFVSSCVSPNGNTVHLKGIITQMEWSKSFESWNAGGSEYYVLITDTAGSRVTLIPSHDTPIEDFAHYTGKHVRVMGNYVEGTPDIPPENSEEQTISPVVNPITGKTDYPIRGSGFRVDKIKIIN